MTVSFTQRYANIHRNSLVFEKSEARGKDVKRLPITGRDETPESTDFLLYDSTTGVLCIWNSFYIVSLQTGATGKERLKEMYSPVVCTGERIYFSRGMLSRIKPDEDEYTVPTYHIPGFPGSWSSLTYLFPFDDIFVSGVVQGPTPKNHQRHKLLLGCGAYKGYNNFLWELTFDKPIPPPPVCNREGNIILYHQGVLRLIAAKDGSTLLEKAIDQEILSSSVGPNGRLYTVASHDLSHYLIEWDEKFNSLWSVEVLRHPWSQPPVTMSNGTVLLVGKGMVFAFREKEQLWQYAALSFTDTTHPFLATATGNNRILLIAGTSLICLDENGKELWVYRKEDASPLRTQPVVGKDGTVYVADDRAIYVVR